MLSLNTMTLGMVTDRTDQIEPVTTMNSDQLASFAPTITATSGLINDNMASLTSLSPNAITNQMKVRDMDKAYNRLLNQNHINTTNIHYLDLVYW